MKIFSAKYLVSQAKIILTLLVLSLVGFTILFYNQASGSKFEILLAGSVTGLFLVIVQFMFSWHEYNERENYRLLGLKRVLEHKKDIEYYGNLIRKSKRYINLIGRTGSHFLEDFANEQGRHKEAKYLLEALGRGVAVRILLSKDAVESDDKVKGTLSRLLDSAGFECRFYDEPQHHSVFISDGDMIIGPFFVDNSSMDTPAIHVDSSAVLSSHYNEHFESVWKKCE